MISPICGVDVLNNKCTYSSHEKTVNDSQSIKSAKKLLHFFYKWAFLVKVTCFNDTQNGYFILKPLLDKPPFPFVCHVGL